MGWVPERGRKVKVWKVCRRFNSSPFKPSSPLPLPLADYVITVTTDVGDASTAAYHVLVTHESELCIK